MSAKSKLRAAERGDIAASKRIARDPRPRKMNRFELFSIMHPRLGVVMTIFWIPVIFTFLILTEPVKALFMPSWIAIKSICRYFNLPEMRIRLLNSWNSQPPKFTPVSEGGGQ